MKVPHYLKRSGAWAIGLKDKLRYDLFFRTTVWIIVAQILGALVMLGIFWWALQYMQSTMLEGIGDYIVETIRLYPALPAEAVTSVADRVKTESILLVLLGMAGLSAVLGFMLSRVTLRPARDALHYQKRFIGNVAHELRTPLSIIKTQTEVSLLDPNLPPSVRATFEGTIEELDRISEVINNLLSFNTLMRPERMTFGNVDLKAVTEKVVATYAALAEKQGVRVSIETGPRFVWGNATALEQVVANLVKNAIFYTPKGTHGAVVIRTQALESGALELSVEDTGIGIPGKELYHIFDPFYRGDASRSRGMGGTSGLGLAIVNEIVRIHRGKIHVASAPQNGTRVSVLLPRGTVEAFTPEPIRALRELPRGAVWGEVSHDFSKGF